MKTKTKILKVFAIVAIFLGNSHLMAQTVTSTDVITQIICVNTLSEPYEVIPISTSAYIWSVVDQATGLPPAAGIADITPSANDWLIYIDWNQPGVYELSFVETNTTTSCSALPVVLTITVEDLASFPVASNPAAICFGDANPVMSATTGGGTGNNVFNWYADAALTTLLATAPTYQELISYPDPGVGLVQSYDYWVTEESANGCEGSATMVTVTVTGLPAAPTSLLPLPYEACFGDPTNPLMTAVGAGSTFNWYDNLTGTQVAANINIYTSTEVNPGSYDYNVEEEVGSCTSLQTTFTFTIHVQPAAPSIIPDPIEICAGDLPGDFTANTGGAAGTFIWYSDAALTTVIAGATTCTPTQVLPGSYIYYLTETDPTTTCSSVSSQATFTINELPLVPTVSAAPSSVICDGDANPIFTAAQGTGSTGTTTFNWYDVDPATNPLAIPVATSVSTFTPTQTAVNTYTFWLTETNSTTTCEGGALSFIFEIISLPGAPTITPNPYEICYGDSNPALTPTGSNLIWYDNALLANQIGTGASFTPPITVVGNANAVTTYPYWVVDQPSTCVSPPLQVDLQINPLPTPGPIWHN